MRIFSCRAYGSGSEQKVPPWELTALRFLLGFGIEVQVWG